MARYPKKDKKTNTYYFVLEAGKDANGKRQRIVRKGFKLKGEADEAMTKLKMELLEKSSVSVEPKNISLGDYLDFWLENYAKIKTKPKTYAEYEKIVKKHLQPAMAEINLKELTSLTVQSYISEKLKVLSAQSVLHHYRVLTKALNNAIKWKYIRENVALDAEAPKPVRKAMKVLDEDQLNLLLKTAKEVSPVYYPAISAAVHCGMRKSEIIGNRWQDIDLMNQKLRVIQTITESGGKNFFNDTPKSGKPRGIKLTKSFSELLRELKDNHDNRKKVLGDSYNPHNLVFCNSKGNKLSHSELSRALKRVLKAADLPDIRFHDLRHSHATLLLKANVHPKIVAERLGHSVEVLMETYSHVTGSIEEIAVQPLDNLLD